MAEDLTQTLMRALRQLPIQERSAYVMLDLFGMPTDEVADMLEVDVAEVLLLARRARSHIRAARRLM